MGFFTILNCSELAFCDEALYKASEKYASNGMSFLYGGELSKQFLKELGKSEEYWLEYVPLKIVETMNTVFNDQIRVCKICGIEPRMERSELMAYWKEMYSTLCMIESFYHIDQTDNFRKCYNFAEENSFILDPEIWKHMKEEAIVRYSRLPPPHDHIAKPAERK